MIGRLLSSIALGLCISVCGGGLIFLVATLANLPRILTGLAMLWRFMLRTSYLVYAWLFSQVQPLLLRSIGFDLLTKVPRALASVLLSLGLGWGLMAMLGWQFSIWSLLGFGGHGLLVGLAWHKIIRPDEFQLGEKLP